MRRSFGRRGQPVDRPRPAHLPARFRRSAGPASRCSSSAWRPTATATCCSRSRVSFTLDDFVRDCAAMQLEGTELTSYYFPADVSDDDLRRLKRLCFELGLDISGTAVGNDFCVPKGDARDREIADVKRWIDRAELLGRAGDPHLLGQSQAGSIGRRSASAGRRRDGRVLRVCRPARRLVGTGESRRTDGHGRWDAGAGPRCAKSLVRRECRHRQFPRQRRVRGPGQDRPLRCSTSK